MHFGPFRLDKAGRRLWRGEQEIAVAPKALDLLIHLAEHAGYVLTREQLLEALWPETYVDDHALSVQMAEVRKALDDEARQSRYIETRHGRGYCFKSEVRISPCTAPAAIPETRYARSGGVNIAYQVIGEGPIDIVCVCVMGLTHPCFARFLRRLASFSRLILFDKRDTGLPDLAPADLYAVMDAAGSPSAVICGISEGEPMSALFAATYPAKTRALILIGGANSDDVHRVLPAARVPTLLLHRSGASRAPGATFAADQDQIPEEIQCFLENLEPGLWSGRVLATVLVARFSGLEPEARDAFAHMETQIHSQVKWYRGVEAGKMECGLIATFDGPARAVRCACALAGCASRSGLVFRAGLNTGQCENPQGPAVRGPAVEIASNIVERAGAGEVLVTSTLRDLAAGSGLQFEEWGVMHADAAGAACQLFRTVGGGG
jgi:DNA-binding winged helix-turn-helix (wHTH) protein/pimeloyl-ACP methyl ester carboxylesterase